MKSLSRNQSGFFRNRPNPATAFSAVCDGIHVICHGKKVGFPVTANDNSSAHVWELVNIAHNFFSLGRKLKDFFSVVAHKNAQKRTNEQGALCR